MSAPIYDSTDWRKSWKSRTRASAVIRGIDYIHRITSGQDESSISNFDEFGDQVIQLYYDIARVSGWNEENIRRKCLKYLEQSAERWNYTALEKPWCNDKTEPTPNEIIQVVGGIYALERASLSSPYKKEEICQFIATGDFEIDSKAPKDLPYYNSKELIGWNPKEELPPTNQTEICPDCGYFSQRGRKMCDSAKCGKRLNMVSKYRTFSNSLIHTFYAEHALIPFGGHTYRDVLTHLPTLRPYQMHKFTNISWQHFWEECYMVTHLIFTLSNWGELSLDKKLFIHEYNFIKYFIPIHLEQEDIHLVAEGLECLKILGDDDNDDNICNVMKWLMGMQDVNDGSWDPSDETGYNKFHATMCAVQTLMVHKRRGHGPGIVNVLDLLIQWHENDKLTVSSNDGISGMSIMDPRGRKLIHLTDGIMLNTLSKIEAEAQGLFRITVGSSQTMKDEDDDDDDDDEEEENGQDGQEDSISRSSTSDNVEEIEKNNKIRKSTSSPSSSSNIEISLQRKHKKAKMNSSNKTSSIDLVPAVVPKKKTGKLKTFQTYQECVLQLKSIVLRFANNNRNEKEITKQCKHLYKSLMNFTEYTVSHSSSQNQLLTSLLTIRTLACEHNFDKVRDYTNIFFANKLSNTSVGKLSNAVIKVSELVENKSYLSDSNVKEQLEFWYPFLIPKSIYTQNDLVHSRAAHLVKHIMKNSSVVFISEIGTIVFNLWKKDLKSKTTTNSGTLTGASNAQIDYLKKIELDKKIQQSFEQKKLTKKRQRVAKNVASTRRSNTFGTTKTKTNTRTKKLMEYNNPKEYVGERVKNIYGKEGKIVRYFSGDEEDVAVWKVAYDEGGDDEMEELDMKKARQFRWMSLQKVNDGS